jgi:hypothetical protein
MDALSAPRGFLEGQSGISLAMAGLLLSDPPRIHSIRYGAIRDLAYLPKTEDAYDTSHVAILAGHSQMAIKASNP